jgi:hypothetical protein
MGSASLPLKVKPFMAVLYRPEVNIEKLLEGLKAAFGRIDCSYGPIPFSFSDYYKDEMGSELLKSYYTFATLMDRETLSEKKRLTNTLEQSLLVLGKRCVNLDPGYLARDKLVLATTKDFYHRLFLSDGIYGEVTLHFRKGEFRYFSWTYPDYKAQGFLEFLTKTRAAFMHGLRTEHEGHAAE